MLVLVGNSPSSGSTFLADLLDSTPFTVCGNELNLFSNRLLYDFHKFKRNPYKTSNSPQIAVTGLFPRYKWFNTYGFNENDWLNWIDKSNTVQEFATFFSQHCLFYRNKDNDGVVFEKTPENLNAIDLFLKAFPESHFLSIVRNPLYVYSSMRKRGFGNYVASLTWLVDCAKLLQYKNHPRVTFLKYEELVLNPFEIIEETLKSIVKKDISAKKIEQQYNMNNYRKENTKKIQSWSINTYGTVSNANKRKILEEEIMMFAPALSYRINPLYAKIFNIVEIDFKKALQEFGYYEEINDKIPNAKNKLLKETKDYKKLMAKWYRFKKDERRKGSIKTFLNPCIL